MGIEMKLYMTIDEFKSLRKRDYENGAVKDEIYRTIRAYWAMKEGAEVLTKRAETAEVEVERLNKVIETLKERLPKSSMGIFGVVSKNSPI